MISIQFTIDSDEYEVTIDPPMGDLDQVYRSQDEIARRVDEAGYEFVDEPPQYRILAMKHKRSGDSSTIDLGDITGKVRPQDESHGGEIVPTETGEDGEELDSEDGEEQEEVEITLIGPDGVEDTRSYGRGQALGSVAADIKRINDISHDRRVVIYRSRERNRELPRETMVSTLDGERLFWDDTDRL